MKTQTAFNKFKAAFTVAGYVIAVMIISITFTACSESDNPIIDPGTTYYLTTNFDGIVHNMPDNARTVNAIMTKDTLTFIPGVQTIGPDSMLNITPLNPTGQYLMPTSILFAQFGTGNVTLTDPNAQGNYANILAYQNGVQTYSGVLTRANTPTIYVTQTGNVYMLYYYSDRNVNITGSSLKVQGGDTTRYNIALGLGTGYNKVLTEVKAMRPNYLELSIYSGDPAGLEWYYIQNILEAPGMNNTVNSSRTFPFGLLK
ncbi:MAG: hypothetical protein ABI528_06840 [bacterium]